MKNQWLKTKFTKLLLCCAVLGVFLSTFVSAAQAQTVTFAQFIERNGTQDFTFTNNTTSANFNTFSGGSAVFFLYSNIVGLDPSLQGFQNAHLFYSTTTTAPATLDMNNLNQPLNQVVVISIIRDTPAEFGIGIGTRTNLLTATISPNTATPSLIGTDTGNSAAFSASTPDHVVTFTSDFLSFSTTMQRNLAIGFSSVTPALTLGTNNFLRSFTAAAAGTFASNPPPIVVMITAAPANISGRVLTSAGRGVSGARVNITEASGTTRTVLTNSFGYYRFLDVSSGQIAIVSAFSKRYAYTPQVVSVTNDLDGLNFTPEQ